MNSRAARSEKLAGKAPDLMGIDITVLGWKRQSAAWTRSRTARCMSLHHLGKVRDFVRLGLAGRESLPEGDVIEQILWAVDEVDH